MASTPAFAATPRSGQGITPGAETSRATPVGAGVKIFTAGASGAIITWIHLQSVVTTTAGWAGIFVYDAGNTAYIYWEEVLVPVVAIASGVAPWSAFAANVTPQRPINLEASWEIWVTRNAAEALHAVCSGGDF